MFTRPRLLAGTRHFPTFQHHRLRLSIIVDISHTLAVQLVEQRHILYTSLSIACYMCNLNIIFLVFFFFQKFLTRSIESNCSIIALQRVLKVPNGLIQVDRFFIVDGPTSRLLNECDFDEKLSTVWFFWAVNAVTKHRKSMKSRKSTFFFKGINIDSVVPCYLRCQQVCLELVSDCFYSIVC